ncbi:hypothetical protein CDAR_614931 [Caerostris darwini]|uniref:Uncharacterized protein n=1 Tax=Caerostris darwini TaxID=1538125 RepID=A0AAV4RRB7_9ARAC|nr:hypothetical protein CDAR_614931 [Caerostris darwini]
MGMLLPINYLAALGLVYIRKSIENRGPSLSPVGARLHVNPELIRAKFNVHKVDILFHFYIHVVGSFPIVTDHLLTSIGEAQTKILPPRTRTLQLLDLTRPLPEGKIAHSKTDLL